MEPHSPSLDTIYTQLANAIDRAGTKRSELFLSMLSLKLISQQTNFSEIEKTIAAVLADTLRPQGGSDVTN